MHDIDFLPSEYRQRTRERRDSRWRLITLSATGLLLSAVTTFQHFTRVSLEDQLAVAEAQASVAQAQTARLSELVAARQAATAKAELITWLRHPWPRTQVLANLVLPLPNSITLTSLSINREQPHCANSAVLPAEVAAAQPQDPHLKDLATLRAAVCPETVVAELTGMTSDPGSLYEYAEKLAEQNLVAKAELLRVDRVSDPNRSGFRFSIRVLVKPPLGQESIESTTPAGQPARVPQAGVKRG